jgi:hypothetical protein
MLDCIYLMVYIIKKRGKSPKAYSRRNTMFQTVNRLVDTKDVLFQLANSPQLLFSTASVRA